MKNLMFIRKSKLTKLKIKIKQIEIDNKVN